MVKIQINNKFVSVISQMKRVQNFILTVNEDRHYFRVDNKYLSVVELTENTLRFILTSNKSYFTYDGMNLK